MFKWLRYSFTLLLSVTLFTFFNISFADEVDDLYQSNVVKTAMQTFMQINKIPGAAVLLYVNGVPHSYYFGYENLSTLQPVNGQTLFEIGSVTKIFTSLLLAENVKAGRISLESTVGNLLPDFSMRSRNFYSMTFEQLATHTSGLPFDVPNQIRTREQLARYLQTWRFPSRNGHAWIYSNVGMGLLGDSLEALTHESYNELYRRNILLPLGMQPIGIDIPAAFYSHYAQGYKSDGQPAKRVNLAAKEASGSMKASPNDMLRFLRAALGLPGTPSFILSAMRLTQTPFVQLPTFEQGLGWQIHHLDPRKIHELLHPSALMHVGPIPAHPLFFLARHFNSENFIDKTGTTAGFRAYIAVIPAKHTGIVIMVNKRVSDPALLTTARSILFRLNGLV